MYIKNLRNIQFNDQIFKVYGCRGKDSKSCNGSWAPSGTISNVQGEEMVAKGISNLALVDKGAFRGQSEEECLLGRDEHGSNMHSVYQKDPPNRHQQQGCAPQTRRKEGNIKYPRRGCCYRIKCVAATFLAALMWRGPVNSAALATITYKRLKGGVRWDKHSSKDPDNQ